MANPPIDCYVDPSIAANSGTGTIGDPYGDLQYALDTETRNSSHGNRFNIKSTGEEVLTASLSLTTYGTPSVSTPILFQGYTSAQGDGGKGKIDCNGFTLLPAATQAVTLMDLELRNGPTSGSTTGLVATDDYTNILFCKLSDCTTSAFYSDGTHCLVYGCHIEDVGGSSMDAITGVLTSAGAPISVIGNYFKQGASRTMRSAINLTGASSGIYKSVAIGNIISVDGVSSGIIVGTSNSVIISDNTIFSAAGTGFGIDLPGSFNVTGLVCTNNYVEGFSGAGGKGFEQNVNSFGGGLLANNLVYNCATAYNLQSSHLILFDNDTLTASGLLKSGSDTYANRLTYFQPVDEGAMLTGGLPESR